ncbi:MAG: hypothetical protein ACYC1D_19165 [Acidimicrobiales bacterium]
MIKSQLDEYTTTATGSLLPRAFPARRISWTVLAGGPVWSPVAPVGVGAVALVREMFDRTERAFAALIEEGKRSGEIGADRDPRNIASLLLRAEMFEGSTRPR